MNRIELQTEINNKLKRMVNNCNQLIDYLKGKRHLSDSDDDFWDEQIVIITKKRDEMTANIKQDIPSQQK